MDGVDGTIKNFIFCKVKSGCLAVHTPFGFHQVVLKYVPPIKSIYLAENDVLEWPENVNSEGKPIAETLQIPKVERCEEKGVYGLKFFYLADDEKSFFTQWYANGKDVIVCGHKNSNVDIDHCTSCFGKSSHDRYEE